MNKASTFRQQSAVTAFCFLALASLATPLMRATVTHEPPQPSPPGIAQPEPSATPSDPDADEKDDDLVSDDEGSEDSDIDKENDCLGLRR